MTKTLRTFVLSLLLMAIAGTTQATAQTAANTQGGDTPKREVFTVSNPDDVLSPYTGLTRQHWIEAGKYLLKGAFSYIHCLDDQMYFPKQLEKTYPRSESQIPVAKIEGLARTLFIAAPLLKNDSNLTIGGIRVADYYRHQLVSLTNPESRSYIAHRTGGPSQTLLELGSLCISMKGAQRVLWDPLTKAQKDALASLMLSYGEGPTIGSNWMFFNVYILSFFKDQGYKVDEGKLTGWVEKLLDRYKGEGWYNDAPAYDYYSMWAYQSYGPLWAEMFGKRMYPELAQRFIDNEHDLVANYPYMFARDGRMNMWGRSICYRFAAVTPLPLLEYAGFNDVDYGWMRHIASASLMQFLSHPDFLENGIPTMGFYGPFAPAVQIYSCRGSVFWIGKAFLSLLLPADAKYWTATETEGPWATDLKAGKVYNKFQPGSTLLITNYPNCGGSEMRSWCHETVAADWQKFRSSENYNKLAYNTEFPWMADGKNGEISMNYGTKNKKGEWEVLRLYTFRSFDNGVYRRDAVLETDSTIRYQLADIPLPDGILRIDRVTTASPTDITLGHYTLPTYGADSLPVAHRTVGHYQATTVANGHYTLAMVPLLGWDETATVCFPKDLHPVSRICALPALHQHVEGSRILVSLQLWKKGTEAFTDRQLMPVKAVKVSADQRIVTVTLTTGEKKTVKF